MPVPAQLEPNKAAAVLATLVLLAAASARAQAPATLGPESPAAHEPRAAATAHATEVTEAPAADEEAAPAVVETKTPAAEEPKAATAAESEKPAASESTAPAIIGTQAPATGEPAASAGAGRQAAATSEPAAPAGAQAPATGESAAPAGAQAPATGEPAASASADTKTPTNSERTAAASRRASARQEPGQPVWLPAEIGRRWTYIYVRERSRKTGDDPPEVEQLRGTLESEIVAAAPEFGADVVRLHSRVRGEAGSASAEAGEELETYLRSSGTSWRIVAQSSMDPVAGRSSLARYSPPLVPLQAGVGKGEPWPIGVREEGGLRTVLEGEILGVQDVQTPAGAYERCLVVRQRGTVSGVLEAYGARIEVPEGEFTSTTWYAPGVGQVLVKEELVETMVLQDGETLEYRERTQYALRATESGESGESEPAPASAEESSASR